MTNESELFRYRNVLPDTFQVTENEFNGPKNNAILSSTMLPCPIPTLQVWHLGSGQQVACLEGHSGVVRACQFSPDSSLIASCSWDKSILLHRTANFEVSLFKVTTSVRSKMCTPFSN